ncbi:A disintegrin and metalloproteinase with thrombospondin motifs 19-like [Haliotis rufescens]|uniref:A disintegrin and metalloproteinase with thrombospondin motifs 19-like n=1 Tax=Haliotis rufescens TaxID=6454 RepID=UPI00201FB38B|nr:A disintegrin and metalloproteinase with thrombospondin motifs 19-like [Haliotis rufescens]
MGSGHDGEIGCQDNDFFVMAAFVVLPNQIPGTLLDNLFRFSTCSIAKFDSFLRSAACTRQSSSLPAFHLGGSEQLFDADEQCRLFLGPASRFCREATSQRVDCFESMCSSLLCLNPASPTQCREFLPFDETACGNGKFCEAGRCVSHTRALATVDGCPQGDDPSTPCEASLCPTYNACTKNILCCQTCNEPNICLLNTTTIHDNTYSVNHHHHNHNYHNYNFNNDYVHHYDMPCCDKTERRR